MVLRISRKAMVAEWTEQSSEENQRDKKCQLTAVGVLRRQHRAHSAAGTYSACVCQGERQTL